MTFAPTSTTSPTNSWPTTIGTGIVWRAQASQLWMCTSVPQIPVRSTRINTSLMPICGTGTSSNQRPGRASRFTSAFILVAIGIAQFRWAFCIFDCRVQGRNARTKVDNTQLRTHSFIFLSLRTRLPICCPHVGRRTKNQSPPDAFAGDTLAHWRRVDYRCQRAHPIAAPALCPAAGNRKAERYRGAREGPGTRIT